ncbi:MAG: DMT family transporter [Desulfobacterales bacterium]|nr:DMT family transporter [Desulfobacterales bacterium]
MIHFKLILTAFFWGGAFVAGKAISTDVEPCAAAFLRFAIASCLLTLFTWKREGRLPGLTQKQFFQVMLLGLTGIFLYNILFFTALGMINANRAALIIALNPIAITLLSGLLLGQKLPLKTSMGLMISLCGAILVITNGNPIQTLNQGLGRGDLIVMGCVLVWAIYSISGRPLMERFSPLVTVCYASLAGTAMLLIPALYNGLLHQMTGYSTLDWTALAYMGVMATVVGFIWYYEGILTIGPVRSGVFINLVPVSAVILAFLFLDEPITLPLLLGGGLVVTGVYMTQKAT